jgi:hypothetical protein
MMNPSATAMETPSAAAMKSAGARAAATATAPYGNRRNSARIVH